MSKGEWQVNPDGTSYSRDEFVIKVMKGDLDELLVAASHPPLTAWSACHRGTEIRRGEDLLALMRYCEEIGKRLATD